VSRLSAHGLSVNLSGGWEGEIYLRPPDVAAATAPAAMGGRNASQGTATTQFPVLQLANFALPSQRGDFGGGAVELMEAHSLFVSLFEYGRESVGTALFASSTVPWPVSADTFGPNRLQRPLPGQAGAQWFFTQSGRPFCLYVVLGSYLLRRATLRPLNRVLHTIAIG